MSEFYGIRLPDGRFRVVYSTPIQDARSSPRGRLADTLDKPTLRTMIYQVGGVSDETMAKWQLVEILGNRLAMLGRLYDQV